MLFNVHNEETHWVLWWDAEGYFPTGLYSKSHLCSVFVYSCVYYCHVFICTLLALCWRLISCLPHLIIFLWMTWFFEVACQLVSCSALWAAWDCWSWPLLEYDCCVNTKWTLGTFEDTWCILKAYLKYPSGEEAKLGRWLDKPLC